MRRETMRFLTRYLTPYRRTVVVLVLLSVLAAVIDTAIPILYGRALDAVIAARPLQVLAALLVAWLILRIIVDAMRRMISFRGSVVAYRAGLDFSLAAYQHLLALPLSFHHEFRSGEMRERASELANALREFFMRGLFDLVPGILTVILSTAYLFWIDPLLGVVNTAVVATFFVLSARDVSVLDAAWERHERTRRKLHRRMWDAMQNVAVVKASTAERHEQRIAVVRGRRAVVDFEARERVFVAQSRTQDVLFGAGTVVLFGVAAYGAHVGRLTPGHLAVVLGYAFLTWGMVRHFIWVWWQTITLETLRRAYDEIAERTGERIRGGRRHDVVGAVHFDHVRFRYHGDTPVLEDVSFVAAPGQVTAIVGESGEGKSTIVELLSRYYEPQAGTITIDGVNIQDVNIRSLRAQLAYVPQDLILFHDSILDNIRYGKLDASDRAVIAAAKQAALHPWVASLPEGYQTVVGERGLKLSAGQRQRIAIARAFLRKPRLLILDEPTSQLDAATEALIHQSLATLMSGRTTFVIAHRLRTVEEADQILVLKGGRIPESGTHAQLLARQGEYARLRSLQFREAVEHDGDHM